MHQEHYRMLLYIIKKTILCRIEHYDMVTISFLYSLYSQVTKIVKEIWSIKFATESQALHLTEKLPMQVQKQIPRTQKVCFELMIWLIGSI